MTTTSEELEQLTAEILAAHTGANYLFERARHLVTKATEEDRQRRAEIQRLNLKTYSEEEAAAILGMSRDLLARLRVDKNLPHYRPGSLVRYADYHLAQIVEILERPAKRGKGNLRAAS